jgi:predicted methyltransferase
VPRKAGANGPEPDEIHSISSVDRAAWQHPEEVVGSLAIQAGDHVADIGAGDGYFLPYLSDAVGPEGKVYAVEVEPEIIEELAAAVAQGAYANVEVVLGEYDDPLLPDRAIDLVLLVNTYHHIEERPAYFAQLQTDLSRTGRVAIIDPDADLRSVLRLFQDKGHRIALADLREEMKRAGYTESGSFDFLPVQLFEVFTPNGKGERE